MLWDKKDIQIEEIKNIYKNAGQVIGVLYFYQPNITSISITAEQNIHAAGIHALWVNLVFAIDEHRRNAPAAAGQPRLSPVAQPVISHHEAVPCRIVIFALDARINEHFTDIRGRLYSSGFRTASNSGTVTYLSPNAIATAHARVSPPNGPVKPTWYLVILCLPVKLFLHIVVSHEALLQTDNNVGSRRRKPSTGFASDRFIQRDIPFTVADSAAEALKAKTIPASASQIFS